MKIILNKALPYAALLLASACGAAAAPATTPAETATAPASAPTATAASAPAVAAEPATPKLTSMPLVPGLYQSAYSPKNGVLWVTSAAGRPVTKSKLVKIDARARTITASYTPPVVDAATGALEAVYGVAVDDAHDNVWVTNTINNSVAVYRQSDGAHLATLPNVPHAREVVVDEARNVAWASAFGGSALVAFDTRTLKEVRRVDVEGSGPTGLALDARGALYAADLKKDRIIEIKAEGPPRFIPTGGKPTSIALSADGKTAYTADQKAGTLSIIDVESGALRKTVATGAGALAVAVDPKSGKVFVANRGDANVSVVDPEAGTVTETLTTNKNPNHIRFGGGAAWIVDKSGAGPDGADVLHTLSFASGSEAGR